MAMKELSIEEKAKRYNEAYKVAEKIYRFSSDIAEIKRIEEIFPELKEIEDENIRKALTDYFMWNPNGQLLNEFSNREVFAWLEKQGNLMGALQEANKKIDELVEENYYLKEEQKGKLVLTPEAYERILKLGEKQGEQKSAWSEEDEKIKTV